MSIIRRFFAGQQYKIKTASKMNILDTGVVSGNDESRPSVLARGPRSSALGSDSCYACLTYFSSKTKKAYAAFCV